MAEKYWDQMTLNESGDVVHFIPVAPSGDMLGGVTASEKADIDKIPTLQNDITSLDDTVDALPKMASTPTVGQIFQVSAVSEDGKATMTPVDLSYTDVQINGSSITKSGVANIPYATSSQAGVAKVPTDWNNWTGLRISNGYMHCCPCDTKYIDARSQSFAYAPITLNRLPYAVRSAMSAAVSTTDPAWTEDEQKAAQTRMGIVTLTQEEYDLLETKGENTIYVITEA